ncbi:hypothetical protein DL96DRAFT_1625146 [Flagelloscypha sp. PMI_526]|nr:hypothetical protein DL96DRAFT_1625146 [Flagelloscypha sp. PMI_526]
MSTIQRATGNQVEIDEDDELRPSEVFDFICGSGMGGVFAILFSVFQYTANEAINFYLELHERVFSTKTWTQKTRNESAFLLKNTILELLPVDVLEQKFVTADESRSRTLVCAANSKNHAHARLLRTYKSREDPLSCTVLDAILLSIADEDHLDPYPLGQFKELFTGSGHRNSNPTQYVLREICAVFNGVAGALMSCIVNIGKGNPGALTTVNSTDGYLGILRDCEESANDIARQFSGCTNLFFRLSVPQGFQTPAYDIGTVAAHTNSYLAGSECESVTQSLGSHLCHRPGILNVHEIMTYRPSAISPPDDAANPYLSPLGNGERHDPNNSELIQTYIEEGYKWKFGIPLWDPQPTGKVVEIGDVGILTEDGGFCTLFNATVPEDKQQQYRLPPNFSPLELAEGDIEILPAPGARQYLSAGRMLKLPANNQPQFTRGPFKLPFQISHGAVLILKDSPTKITTPRDFHIQQYIERNIENWYAFCKEGLGRDLCGQALMFVTEIRRGFDWALGAWPDLGVEKSISYAGKSTASINNPRGVKGSWIPSHFAFKDGPFGNGPLVDEPKCPHNAFYPNMDETLGKHCVFLKCYRLGFRPLYMLPIQITVPTVSEPKTSWRDYLRQLFPTVLETCRNVVGSSSPPAPSSALQDAFFAPASFLSKVGYGIPVSTS